MTKTAVRPLHEAPQVGDFFCSSWGYDQTNVDFYKVVGVTKSGKSVKVQQWTLASSGEDTHFTAESVVPGDSPVQGAWVRVEGGWREYDRSVEAPVETKRLRSYGEGESQHWYFTVNSFATASKWDGQPEHKTAYGFGH